jgi:hypothetical protein
MALAFQVYLAGLGIIWLSTVVAIRSEPTLHGQDALVGMGFFLGLLWPLFLTYLVLASPWIAWTAWATRGER